MLTSLKAWLWLTSRLEPGPARQVLEHFESPERAYFSDPGEYDLIPKLTQAHRKLLRDKSLDSAERILADCDAKGVRILTWRDTEYPNRLRNIEVPPLVLYYRGTLPRFDEEIAIAIAGTRNATPYGRKAAAELGFQIYWLGGLVLTGIVDGCDRYAADGALKAGGPLVCVLAGGVDVPYYSSPSGQHLLEDVAACGALISEYPPGTAHLGSHFLQRNRILTGLALGTVCVEAPEHSGTLNVARLALEQGRDVYAVPANIDAKASAGTNRLLVRGEAICVCSGADVLEHYWPLYPHKRKKQPVPTPEVQQQRTGAELPEEAVRPRTLAAKPEPVSEPKPSPEQPPQSQKPVIRLSDHQNEYTDDEQAVLLALGDRQMVTDAIVAETLLPARRVSATLTVLTIRGLVRQLPGGRFEAAAQFL